MPPKRTSLGSSSADAKRKKAQRDAETAEQREARLARERERRAQQTDDQREARLDREREWHAADRDRRTSVQRATARADNREQRAMARAEATPEQRATRQADDRERHAEARAEETPAERAGRQADDRERHTDARAAETPEQRHARSNPARERYARARRARHPELRMAGFSYDATRDYKSNSAVAIGTMSKVCPHCKARKFERETPGMCCAGGTVVLPALETPPEPLNRLMSDAGFLANIRSYNSAFQMTSFGADNIIHERNRDGSVPTFKVQGQVYHLAGSLLPLPDIAPGYLQIYFTGQGLDVQADRRHRLNNHTDPDIVQQLEGLFNEHNELCKVFKYALEHMPSDEHQVVIRADKTPTGEHARRFNAPTVDDVAIIIAGTQHQKGRDIILRRRGGPLQRICETHRSYDALQYPILFCRGEDGYDIKIRQWNPATGAPHTNDKKTVSSMHYYAHRIMIRDGIDNHILKAKALFHQYVVDQYAKIETERLLYLRKNQAQLRADEYIHLRDAIAEDGNVDANNLGRPMILPATHIGSPRHMHEYAQDAMTYVRAYGRPDLFLTFTTNPEWEEITALLLPGQRYGDRHDITARVFHQKLKVCMDYIVEFHVFGETRCWMYSVEWQKRGLPHAHILVWLVNKIRPDQIDQIISAEIPDSTSDPELHRIVTKNMMHGPCGILDRNCSCMVNGQCAKRFPKAFTNHTITGTDGYPLYRRRDDGRTVTRNNVQLDNRWVVPYSPILLKAFNVHSNLEICGGVKTIKYLCKYVTKGSDMAVFTTEKMNEARRQGDEITQYQLGRYISSNEAVWRILSFPIHKRHPAVVHLAVHLEGGQRVSFTAANAQERAANPPDTSLVAFFKLCAEDAFARRLLYSEVPTYYTWNTAGNNKFQRRKQGKPVPDHSGIYSTDALGRVYTVHPKHEECFYLRLLLVNVRGPTSFRNLRTVHGRVCETYREACQLLHLLENDSHWDTALADAMSTDMPHQIRTLFAILLTMCFPSNPSALWEKYKDAMCEDFTRARRIELEQPNLETPADVYNAVLIIIEDLCRAIGGKTMPDFGLPAPDRTAATTRNNNNNIGETTYDVGELLAMVETNLPKLNPEQRAVYDTIMQRIETQRGGLLFLDAPGGTGKTFLISLLLATVRSRNQPALAIASSGIAATLLDGGRTAHSALRLALNLHTQDQPLCNVTKNSPMGQQLANNKFFIWDECTMAHRKALEALDRTLRDIRGKTNELFGGALILLSGDFRQTLPVIPRGTAADEIGACLQQSDLWRHVQKLTLTTNMRVQLQQDASAERFAKQLLDLGDGKLPTDPETHCITLPTDFCVRTNTTAELISRVFPDMARNYTNRDWLSERAILAPKNAEVNELNFTIQDGIPGDAKIYNSIDTVVHQDEAVNYPTEFLNSLDLPGMPPHVLKLKVGVPIILLRNIHPPRLCNGTRLSVNRLLDNVIDATILTGRFKGERVLIPRIPMIPTDLAFEFKRLQFPVRPAFAMTINKAQGQTLQVCGLHLENPCFSHGQLYVACSRVGNPSNLFVFPPSGKTPNITYPLTARRREELE